MIISDFISSHIEWYTQRPKWDWWKSVQFKTLSIPQNRYLKSFNPIYRISNRALKALDGVLSLRNSGHHEVVIPTVLDYLGYTINDFGGNSEFTLCELNIPCYLSNSELNNWYTESTMRYRPVFNKEAITRKGIDNMLYHPILIQMEKNGHIKLQSIANILLINIQHIDKLGLWNGKMGVILFFYHYGRYVDKSFYEDVADSLLDLVLEAVSRSAHSDSYALLSSVGIGIEYLLAQQFVESDSDDLLEDFDKYLLSGGTRASSLIQSLYIHVRKEQNILNLSGLLELKNELSPYSSMSIIEEIAQYPLTFSELAWEGLNILNQISNRE